MTARTLMLQGTASSVGKSALVTALCRVFADEGLRVAPFKAQNMSNNAAVTADGREIGRAQAEQARAARVPPDVRMNPVLLKPEGEMRSQVVLLGKPAGTLGASFLSRRKELWPYVSRALDSLRQDYDLVIIEGAGSPAEVNLRRNEIVNMRVALHAQAPVLLVGDVDKGGVFAHLVGTMALLRPRERRQVAGFLINKFRGNLDLLRPGLAFLERRAQRPVLGVMPYLDGLRLADEDAAGLQPAILPRRWEAHVKVAVVRLPHIANFDDFAPLQAEASVELRFVEHPSELDGASLVVLPGSKNTRGDLRWLKQSGLADAVLRLHRGGSAVLGVCGGFQMLGRRVDDPQGVEGDPGSDEGLALLPLVTTFSMAKTTRLVTARVSADRGLLAGLAGTRVEGYEIHMGQTQTYEPCAAVFELQEQGRTRADGALSRDGRVAGTYLHGIFANDALRHGLLRNLAGNELLTIPSFTSWDPEQGIARLAQAARQHLDIDAIRRVAFGPCRA